MAAPATLIFFTVRERYQTKDKDGLISLSLTDPVTMSLAQVREQRTQAQQLIEHLDVILGQLAQGATEIIVDVKGFK